MKKLTALLLALMMCLALAACGGGVDTQPAIDAFNATSDAFNELATDINANADAVDPELLETLTEISGLLTEYKELLEGDQEFTQETLDEMIAWFGEVDALIVDVRAELDEVLSTGNAVGADNEGTSITDEQLKALTEAYNQIAPLYNEVYTAAEKNGWLADEQTVAEINAVGSTMGVIGTALTEDISMLEGADVDALPEVLLQFIPELQKMAEKVAVPFAKG